jgi:hypothetical protein
VNKPFGMLADDCFVLWKNEDIAKIDGAVPAIGGVHVDAKKPTTPKTNRPQHQGSNDENGDKNGQENVSG